MGSVYVVLVFLSVIGLAPWVISYFKPSENDMFYCILALLTQAAFVFLVFNTFFTFLLVVIPVWFVVILGMTILTWLDKPAQQEALA